MRLDDHSPIPRCSALRLVGLCLASMLLGSCGSSDDGSRPSSAGGSSGAAADGGGGSQNGASGGAVSAGSGGAISAGSGAMSAGIGGGGVDQGDVRHALHEQTAR